MMLQTYPVLDILPKLKEAFASNNIIILQAPPGAGKSTVLPLKILEEPWLLNKKIVMLEPRRLAAKSVAERMADLIQTSTGEIIGYRIRFESKVSARTRIEVVTEGILTRMIQSNNSLDDIGLLIFDEFHERSLQADLALALSLQIQQVLRDDLKILIMSATLDGASLSSRLGNVPVITSYGRQFPVTTKYEAQETDTPISKKMAQRINQILREEEGDILAFLPGAGEIMRTHQLLEQDDISAKIFPLYGDLSFKKQQEAILPSGNGERKVVLATAIAETSLTIEGIRIVIDSGLARVPRFDPRSGLTRLDTIRVTKDAADQRAGRAGRLGPGLCFRLWTEGIQLNLRPHRQPEILEADLAPLMLELAQFGIKNVEELTWITSPAKGAVSQALTLLNDLGAIAGQGITMKGKEMLKLPTHPRIAHLLLEAKAKNNLQTLCLATDIAALLEERDPLPKDAGVDLTLRLEALRRWRSGTYVNVDKNSLTRIERIASQWRGVFRIAVDNENFYDDLGVLIMAAYPERIAQQQGKFNERYKLANGRIVKLPPHDNLVRDHWLCVAELDAGGGEGRIFSAVSVSLEDVLVYAKKQQIVRWDDERKMVIGQVERRVGVLLVESKPIQKIDDELRIQVLCDYVKSSGLKVLGWNDKHDMFQARVQSIKVWRPDIDFPDLSTETLLNSLEHWLAPYLINITKQAELDRLDLHAILLGIIPWNLQSKLEELAPSRIEVPSGSQITIQYFSDGRTPIIEVRLQEMFGLVETPTVNEGRTKLLIHFLSPGYKPVQVTQDLKSFWQTAYHEIRKELRMRYPRHHWPEDPWTAEAVRGAKRRQN